MTGDGGDELFAGYNYLKRYYSNIKSLNFELQRLWKVMHFSSKQVGKVIEVDVKTPFLDREFSMYAKHISATKKIGEYRGQKWGKFILRKCFEEELGKEVAWRIKLAQEEGAAITNIKNFIINDINDVTFQIESRQALRDGVKIRDKEHLYYYRIFRKYFSPPKEEKCSYLRCPDCNGCFNSTGRFCHICGAFPVIPT
jgi:asparagine synthase (glutamine-hydrolysing)